MFRQVTDMAWDAAGNTYISDGYINSRVAKVDKNGNWLMSWGEPGDRPGQFNTPHSIATDAQGNVYVADRGNRRIQVFDGDGKFLRKINIDVPFDRQRAPRDRQQARVRCHRHHGPRRALGDLHHARPNQYLYSLRRLSRPDLQADARRQGLGWLGEAGKQLKQFGWIHEIACPSENELYVGELLNWRVQNSSWSQPRNDPGKTDKVFRLGGAA